MVEPTLQSGNNEAAKMTVFRPGGERRVILRGNLEELVSTGKPLMPDGFEKELRPQDVADLIAYLRSQAPPPGKGEPRKP